MDEWVDAGPADLGPGELRGVAVAGRYVLLSLHGGQLRALDDLCNHAGCLLSGGWVDEKKRAVVCPCHEYSFALADGKNVTFPRLCADQQVFEVRVKDGRVQVLLPQGARHG